MIYWFAYAVIFVSMGLTLARLVKGPDAVDRVMSMDLLTTLLACLVVVHVLRSGETLYLDVTLVITMISFFGTLMYGRYLQRRINS